MSKEWLDIEAKTKAGYTYFYLVTPEEDRAALALARLAQRRGGTLYDYSLYRGFNPSVEGDDSPLVACTKLPENSVVLLRDFHRQLSDPFNHTPVQGHPSRAAGSPRDGVRYRQRGTYPGGTASLLHRASPFSAGVG